MSEQIVKEKMDAHHFANKYRRYPTNMEGVSEYLTRHRNGHQRLNDEELSWMKEKYESMMSEVLRNNSEEVRQTARDNAAKNRVNLHKEFYHSKKKHTLRVKDYVEANKNKEGEVSTSRSYCSIFDAFTYVKPGEQDFYYNNMYVRNRYSDERLAIEGGSFKSYGATIGRRWFSNGEPQFLIMPDSSQGYRTTGGDIGGLRQTVNYYYPDTITVIPGFLINWSQDRKRRGSQVEFPRYDFSKVQTGAFSNVEYKPDLIKMGSTPIARINTIEYHILNIEGEHFIYLDQTIEPQTTVLIHIPKRFRGHYSDPCALYLELTHPEGVNPKEPYFRHGEWYMVPSDMKTKDLIKCAGGPVEKGSDHTVDEIRKDEDGNIYIRGNMRHKRGDHPLLKLGKKIWYRIFRSDAEGHSADMRGATTRYD